MTIITIHDNIGNKNDDMASAGRPVRETTGSLGVRCSISTSWSLRSLRNPCLQVPYGL